jgi:hypothetical protein
MLSGMGIVPQPRRVVDWLAPWSMSLRQLRKTRCEHVVVTCDSYKRKGAYSVRAFVLMFSPGILNVRLSRIFSTTPTQMRESQDRHALDT